MLHCKYIPLPVISRKIYYVYIGNLMTVNVYTYSWPWTAIRHPCYKCQFYGKPALRS